MAIEKLWVPTNLRVGGMTNVKFRGKHARCHWADEENLGMNGFLWRILDMSGDKIDKRGEGGIIEYGIWFTIEPTNEFHWQREPIEPKIVIRTLIDMIEDGEAITIPEPNFHSGQWTRVEGGAQVIWVDKNLRISLKGDVWVTFRIVSVNKGPKGVTFKCVKE